MTQLEFLQVVGSIRNNCGLDCTGPNYYIFIHNDLKRATVNNSGYVSMANIAYVLVVCAHNWKNFGYVNTSLTQLLMVDREFNPVEEIPFGKWSFKGLYFVTHYGQFYNAWRPIPKLQLSIDPAINNYEGRRCDESESFPEWEWPSVDIKNITPLLESINEFVEANS